MRSNENLQVSGLMISGLTGAMGKVGERHIPQVKILTGYIDFFNYKNNNIIVNIYNRNKKSKKLAATVFSWPPPLLT